MGAAEVGRNVLRRNVCFEVVGVGHLLKQACFSVFEQAPVRHK